MYNYYKIDNLFWGGIILNHTLKKEIESMRKAMLEVASMKGRSANETLELSRDLDKLMNKFTAMTSEDKPMNRDMVKDDK